MFLVFSEKSHKGRKVFYINQGKNTKLNRLSSLFHEPLPETNCYPSKQKISL